MPPSVRYAGFLAAAQGVLALLFGFLLIIRDIAGHEELMAVISGWGTGLWFLIMGSAVLACGLALTRGKRWGRGVVVMTQMLLLPVAYYLFTSGQPVYAGILAVTALAGLAMMFNNDAAKWQASGYGTGR